MKKTTLGAGRISLTLLAGAALCLSSTFVGCGKADIDKPLDRTPNVPASTRGGDSGGVPGGPSDIGKKKKSSSYSPAIKIVQGQC